MYAMPAIKHAAAEYWRLKLCMPYKPQCFGPCSVAILNVLNCIAYQTWQADDPVPAVIHNRTTYSIIRVLKQSIKIYVPNKEG